MSNDLVAIDISHWQPDPIDWGKVALSIVGVIFKATEGTSYVDPTYARRRADAEAAGLKVSSYHFLKHGKIGQQMSHYLATVDPVSGERMCIDYEDPACTLADLQEAVRYLQQTDLDLQITVYSGHLIKEQLGNKHDPLLATTSLWLAQYSSSPSWPTGTWPTWSLWQYTDKAKVPGISGNVDGNRFNGSAEQCARWFGPATEVPAPGPTPPIAPSPDEVNISIFTPPGVPVSVWVNGAPWMENDR